MGGSGGEADLGVKRDAGLVVQAAQQPLASSRAQVPQPQRVVLRARAGSVGGHLAVSEYGGAR